MASTEKLPANAPQQYNLRWTNHTNNILQVFAEHLMQESLVDVTLFCEGHVIKAHKMILSACSTYFNELFQVNAEKHPLVIMYGVKFNDLKMVVEFMYRGEVKVQDKDIQSLLALAENLQVKGLSSVRLKTGFGKSEKLEQEKTKEQPQPRRAAKRRKTASESQNNENLDIPAQEPMLENRLEHNNYKTEPGLSSPTQETESDSERLLIDESEGTQTQIDKPEKFSDSSTAINDEEQTQRLLALNEDVENDTESFLGSQKFEKQDSASNIMFVASLENINNQKNLDKQLLKIPRPPNAFMIFANEWRKKLAVENPGESNKDISVRLGTMWKLLSPAARETYYEAAKKADIEHKNKFPGYYYSPKEARIRKVTKTTVVPCKKESGKVFDTMQLVKLVMPDSNNQNGNSVPNTLSETEEVETFEKEITTVDITEDDPNDAKVTSQK